MKFWHLTEEQELIRDMATKFGSEVCAPTAATRDKSGTFCSDELQKLTELGLLGVKVPFDDGGAGADMVSYALALAAISQADASVGVTMAVCNLAADILSRFGSAAQKNDVLAPYLRGEKGAGAFCLSEPHCGSDAAALKTTAVKEGDKWILNGEKQWITNGGYAGVFIVFAVTDKSQGARGLSAFLLGKDTPGFVIGKKEHKMGLRSSDTVPLSFQDAEVAEDALLGEVGQGYSIALSGLDTGRVGIAAQSIGIGEAGLLEGLRYAQERKAFGTAVASFQASQFAIADSRTDLDRAWLLTMKAAALLDTKGHAKSEASMAKLYASEAACRVVDRMLQLHGGYGYVEDFAIERLYRDARVTRIYEGTSEVQRIVIARELLKS